MGKDNADYERVFGMGFLYSEDGNSVTWFLFQLFLAKKHCPKVIFSDASAAIIAAIRKVFPRSFILLYGWYLNQRQYANVINTLGKK